MIKIMKASAGSGKTYNLTKTYISLLLKSDDRYAYRHILAVTFTNKATAEMKNRILKELHILASDTSKSAYLEEFVPSVVPDIESLKERSRGILVDILHDYAAFSVSTIDKFFQMTLKAFSREIGQFASYQVELDKKSLIRESVDRILDSLSEDSPELIGWLNDGVKEQLGQGQRVNLEKKLYDVAERLKSEEHRELAEEYHVDPVTTLSQASLAVVRQECESVVKAFEKEVREASSAVVSVMNQAGVSLSETSNGFLARFADYAEMSPGCRVARPTATFFKCAPDKDKWFAKSKAARLLPRVDGLLDEPLARLHTLFEAPFKAYSTALLLKDQVHDLGIAGDFYREFGNLLKEKNVLSLDDSNSILRGIIDGSDAPFVYEKLGVRFEHFLLDEFQDTSTIQWQNFLPLLKESNASGNDNLVVGDVKQSIYRWRGSDWKLLASKLGVEFPDAEEEVLNSNWRSCPAVVSFNNAFFKFASQMADVEELYSDVSQNAKSDDIQDGCVRISFCPAEKELALIFDSVREAVSSGAGYGDIAVLVRRNIEGGVVANFLRDNGIPIISDDSLSIRSSVTVRRLVSLLSCLENPEDSVNSYLAESLEVEFPDSSMSLADLCESLIRSLASKDPDLCMKETLYIQSFMDFLQEWSSVNGNSLSGFLKHWAEVQPPCLSSPDDSDAVRIMTIHKSKGLEFPHVIFPFAEKVGFYRHDWHWCRLPEDVPGMPSAAGTLFPVDLSDNAGDTYFSDDLCKEKSLQLVDNLNTFYVAFTRAEKTLDIIACTPPASFLKSGQPKDFSQLLHAFLGTCNGLETARGEEADTVRFTMGSGYDYSRMQRKISSRTGSFPAEFSSFPLGGRLRLSSDAADFFGDDGTSGPAASRRLNGIVLHDILASVRYPSDIETAVLAAVNDGRLSSDEGHEDLRLLCERVESVRGLGWFPESGSADVRIFNESTIIASDGNEYRPDRVIETPSGTVIVDYKFGERKDSYLYQVRRYMRLFRQMGRPNVSGYVWYVGDGVIEKVS